VFVETEPTRCEARTRANSLCLGRKSMIFCDLGTDTRLDCTNLWKSTPQMSWPSYFDCLVRKKKPSRTEGECSVRPEAQFVVGSMGPVQYIFHISHRRVPTRILISSSCVNEIRNRSIGKNRRSPVVEFQTVFGKIPIQE
jgi:hypothetical protein